MTTDELKNEAAKMKRLGNALVSGRDISKISKEYIRQQLYDYAILIELGAPRIYELLKDNRK